MYKTNHLQPGMLLICATPIAPLRSHAAETSELETQMLYGERATIIALGHDDWVQLETTSDHYTAWADKKHFIEWSGTLPTHVSTSTIQLISGHHGPTHIPLGSLLSSGEKSNKTICQPIDNPIGIDPEKVESMARLFLNAPYLWGGKTIMGIDCSGFTQIVFSPFGIILPRNASQQQTKGDDIPFNHASAGDVAFFLNDKERIVHTGILIPGNKIIHASGFVRIDRLTTEGIIHAATGTLTHRLHSIKRMFT